jgi:hypothetical protein
VSKAQRRSWEAAHEERILGIREIVRTEQLETVPDLYNTAMLLQHGIAREDFLIFSRLTLRGRHSSIRVERDIAVALTDLPSLLSLNLLNPGVSRERLDH